MFALKCWIRGRVYRHLLKQANNVGIGLRNTVDRLHEFYADNHTFNLESVPSGGLKVYMQLPLEKTVR